jgi:signal peptidase II
VKNRLQILRSYLVLIGIAGLVVGLDQWTKYLVRTRLDLGQEWSPLPGTLSFIRIIHWKNTGAAFGLFPQGSLIFTAMAILVSLAILYYWPRVPSKQVGLRIALALQLAGAVGNLIDRLSEGIVTDFIAVGTFPVFNVADSSISIGVALLVIVTWWEERKRKAKEGADKGVEPSVHDEQVQEVDSAG